MSKQRKSYKKAGVDVEAGNLAARKYLRYIRSTKTSGVLDLDGGFSGLFELDSKKYSQPVLVSGSDGVGTKLRVAFLMNRHDTVGEDLVAMSVNDILVQGAKPLFFLDYFSTGKLKPAVAVQVVKGISKGCQKAGCALIGGETAEMPGFYPPGEYDLAGFAVGVVDKKDIITGSKIRPGDIVIGLPSTGLHSNGFSLARKVLLDGKFTVKSRPGELKGKSVGEVLLKPTRIYVREVLDVISRLPGSVRGLAHITGGGVYDNIPRVLPEKTGVRLDAGAFRPQPVYDLIQKTGRISEKEMFGVFNMGLGMVIIVKKAQADLVMKGLKKIRAGARIAGEVVKGNKDVEVL